MTENRNDGSRPGYQGVYESLNDSVFDQPPEGAIPGTEAFDQWIQRQFGGPIPIAGDPESPPTPRPRRPYVHRFAPVRMEEMDAETQQAVNIHGALGQQLISSRARTKAIINDMLRIVHDMPDDAVFSDAFREIVQEFRYIPTDIDNLHYCRWRTIITDAPLLAHFDSLIDETNNRAKIHEQRNDLWLYIGRRLLQQGIRPSVRRYEPDPVSDVSDDENGALVGLDQLSLTASLDGENEFRHTQRPPVEVIVMTADLERAVMYGIVRWHEEVDYGFHLISERCAEAYDKALKESYSTFWNIRWDHLIQFGTENVTDEQMIRLLKIESTQKLGCLRRRNLLIRSHYDREGFPPLQNMGHVEIAAINAIWTRMEQLTTYMNEKELEVRPHLTRGWIDAGDSYANIADQMENQGAGWELIGRLRHCGRVETFLMHVRDFLDDMWNPDVDASHREETRHLSAHVLRRKWAAVANALTEAKDLVWRQTVQTVRRLPNIPDWVRNVPEGLGSLGMDMIKSAIQRGYFQDPAPVTGLLLQYGQHDEFQEHLNYFCWMLLEYCRWLEVDLARKEPQRRIKATADFYRDSMYSFRSKLNDDVFVCLEHIRTLRDFATRSDAARIRYALSGHDIYDTISKHIRREEWNEMTVIANRLSSPDADAPEDPPSMSDSRLNLDLCLAWIGNELRRLAKLIRKYHMGEHWVGSAKGHADPCLFGELLEDEDTTPVVYGALPDGGNSAASVRQAYQQVRNLLGVVLTDESIEKFVEEDLTANIAWVQAERNQEERNQEA